MKNQDQSRENEESKGNNLIQRLFSLYTTSFISAIMNKRLEKTILTEIPQKRFREKQLWEADIERSGNSILPCAVTQRVISGQCRYRHNSNVRCPEVTEEPLDDLLFVHARKMHLHIPRIIFHLRYYFVWTENPLSV